MNSSTICDISLLNLWLFLVLLFILLNQNVITGYSCRFLIFKYVTHVRILLFLSV